MSLTSSLPPSLNNPRATLRWRASSILALCGAVLMTCLYWLHWSGPSAVLLSVIGFIFLSSSIMLNIATATSMAAQGQWSGIPQALAESALALLVLQTTVLP